MSKKVIIVGGVAGGASAAARLRRLDETAQIMMFERGPHISFANCGLPYYIGGAIQDRQKLLVQTPEAMNKRFAIDVRPDSEVVAIDVARKVVVVQSKHHGQYEENYDQLILSPGAKPIRPAWPGIDSELIYTIRNLEDVDRVKERVLQEQTKSAIVIGGGYIGVEMAENLREIGLDVTLMQSGSQLLAPFDQEMAAMLALELEKNGVRVMLNTAVQGFQHHSATPQTETHIDVLYGKSQSLRTDMVILAIGVIPDTSFVQGSGIKRGARGHIVVNNKMQTNVADVYAVGDAVEVQEFVTGRQTTIPLAGPANKQGRIVADQISGLSTTYKGTQGTSILKVFSLTGATTGLNEKMLREAEIPYHVTFVHPQSHASYYPGATPLVIKLLFHPEGTILGAQIVGSDSVDKRIDDIATVIRFRGTVEDLTELELAYAPPYSSAKDPVNMAAYTAENVLHGLVDLTTPADLATMDWQQTTLVDVRTLTEYENGHIEGAKLLPVDELRGRLAELDIKQTIIVYCQVGMRGYIASRILKQHGYQVKNLTGGYKTYLMYRNGWQLAAQT